MNFRYSAEICYNLLADYTIKKADLVWISQY